MTVEDFVKNGCLQEINRQLLHPRGLALAVEYDDDGKLIGFHNTIIEKPDWKFDFAHMSDKDFQEAMFKQDAFEALHSNVRQTLRIESEGYIVEPVKK